MIFEIYCDESCQEVLTDRESHKYMGIGGIWIPAYKREEIKNAIFSIREKYKIFGEIKWNKVTSTYLEFYKSIVKYFIDAPIRFRVIIITSAQIDNVKFNQSDAELGFYKFYYQLIHHWILDNNEYKIFLDLKTSRDRTRLKVLNQVLNCSNLTSNISQVQSLPSGESIGIQLADLLTGLTLAKFNGEITSDAKKELIRFSEVCLERRIGLTFNVFRIKLQGGW